MLQIDKNDLFEIELDLKGMIDLLTVMEASDFYKDTNDDGVCRALRNSLEYTKEKLSKIMETAQEVPFEV